MIIHVILVHVQCTLYILHSTQMPQLYKLINDDSKIAKYFYYETTFYIMTNQHNVV